MNVQDKAPDYLPVADVEVTSVRHQKGGFTLLGTGADRADYRVDLELEVPVDQRTRTVLGEILSQSKWRITRKASKPIRPGPRAARSSTTPTSG